MRENVDHHHHHHREEEERGHQQRPEEGERDEEKDANARRKSKCHVANAILHAFEEQSNTNAGAFFSFLAGPCGLVVAGGTGTASQHHQGENPSSSSSSSSSFSWLRVFNRPMRRKRFWAMFFDGYFGRLWTMSLAIAIASFPSLPWLVASSREEEDFSSSTFSSKLPRSPLPFETVCAAASVLTLVALVDCWLRVKCVQGYSMSFAAIVDGLSVVMTPILPVVREFILYEQSIGKREDDALTYGTKAFAVGFAEFLFLMRLCIAGAQFLSARWEGKSARYGGSNSEKSNASAAGVFRRLEQAGAANIALLVATTVTLGPIASGGENSITIVRNYAYYEGANASEVDRTRAMRRLMEAGLALVASALFNALFISMRMHLLGKPFEKIVEILERHARSILTDLDDQMGEKEGGNNNSNDDARPYEGITGSLDISVLAYVLEKMSNIVDSSTQLRKRHPSLATSSLNGDSPQRSSTNQLLIQAILEDHSVFAGLEVDDSTKAWLKSYDVNSVTRLGNSVTTTTKSKIHSFAAAVTKMAGAKKAVSAFKSINGTQQSSTAAIALTDDEKVELNSWNFKVFEYGEGEEKNISKNGVATEHNGKRAAALTASSPYAKAFSFVVEMFRELGLLSVVVDEPVLRVFLHEVAKLYRSNPYHNFTHALDVAHTTFRYIKLTKSRTKITKLERFAVMVAAIIHDVDHPGLTNAFLVRTRDPLATTYNDQSVLENHHLSYFFNLIERKKEANIFDYETTTTTGGQSGSYFTEESYREVRRIIIACVMHTDMATHFGLVSKMNEFVVSHDFLEALQEEEKGEENDQNEEEDVDDDDDQNEEDPLFEDGLMKKDKGAFFKTDDERQLMLNVLLHSADISNAVKPFPTYKMWATRVLEEFFNQGDREKTLGLPVSPMMDRETTIVSVSQINFIEFVVAPLYSAFSKMFPETQSMCVELVENRRIWQERLEDEIERDATKTDAQKKSEREQFEKRFRGLIDKHFSRTNAFKNAEDPIAKRVLSTPPHSRRGSATMHSSPLASARSTPSRKRSVVFANNNNNESPGGGADEYEQHATFTPQRSDASSDSFVSMLSNALKAAKKNGGGGCGASSPGASFRRGSAKSDDSER
jgi:high affinity cGMP-specific 3',5'-cyclic phosphodiesterase 9